MMTVRLLADKELFDICGGKFEFIPLEFDTPKEYIEYFKSAGLNPHQAIEFYKGINNVGELLGNAPSPK